MIHPRGEDETSQIQFSISVTNAGMNISFSADNEFMNGMLIVEPLSYVPITSFPSRSIMPTLATIGPWAHGYGIRPTRLDI